MNKLTDVDKYPTFMIKNNRLIKVSLLDIEGTTFSDPHQWHHFVRKTIRKNNPEFYARVEHLQKMILMPSEMNYDLEGMSENGFANKWGGLNKDDLVFNRSKWREGYYE